VVTDPLAGVVSGGYEPCVGGELVGARESGKISYDHQELGAEDRTHAGQASEDPGLGTGEKTLLELLVEGRYAPFEGERLLSEFGTDRGGDAFGRQHNALGLGRGEGPAGEGVRSLDAAVFEEDGETFMSRSADGGWSLVVREQSESTLVVEVEGTLQCREEGKEGLPESSDSPGLIHYEIASTSEEELELGEVALFGGEYAEVRSHPGLIGDDAGVFGVGLGLPAIGVARPLHGHARDVEDSVIPLPQQRQKKRRASSSGLVDGPGERASAGKGEDFLNELKEVGLVVLNPAREKFGSRGVHHVGPVKLLARVDAHPYLVVHERLRSSSLVSSSSPSEVPAGGSLCSECWPSPISMSGRGLLVRGRGAIPFKPSNGGAKQAILGPLGRHSGTVPERQTQR
jgi:hypothetical protein